MEESLGRSMEPAPKLARGVLRTPHCRGAVLSPDKWNPELLPRVAFNLWRTKTDKNHAKLRRRRRRPRYAAFTVATLAFPWAELLCLEVS